NYVVIAHAGGLETQYLHFTKVVVKPGDKVKAGDLIGYSGKTGWACGSHLHFKVARALGDGWNNPSLPATVKGFGDPQTGEVIDSGACGADRRYIASLDAPGAEQIATRVEQVHGSAGPQEQLQPALSASGGDKVVSNK